MCVNTKLNIDIVEWGRERLFSLSKDGSEVCTVAFGDGLSSHVHLTLT